LSGRNVRLAQVRGDHAWAVDPPDAALAPDAMGPAGVVSQKRPQTTPPEQLPRHEELQRE
jgi:hypothetical protein